MDAGKYYALLRFEEASCALRAALRLNIVEEIGNRELDMEEFRVLFGFTEQGARTYAALLEVMEVITRRAERVSIPDRAKACLLSAAPTTRRPYLEMGSGSDVDQLRFTLQNLPGKDHCKAP